MGAYSPLFSSLPLHGHGCSLPSILILPIAHEEPGLHPLTLVPGLFNMINIPPVNELLVAAVAALEQTLSWVSGKKQL